MKAQIALALASSLVMTLPVMAQVNTTPGGSMGFGYATPSTSTATPGGSMGFGYPTAGTTTYPGLIGTPANPYQSTTGFYNPNVGTINYPGFGTPVCVNGSNYTIPSGNCSLPMWRAPSGYYYPWCPRPANFVYAYPMPILLYDTSTTSTPAPALPPVGTMMTDMEKYLDDSKKNGKLTERDYTNMSRRVKDLKAKDRTMRIAAGGSLDPADETQLRNDLEQVSSELTWRLNR